MSLTLSLSPLCSSRDLALAYSLLWHLGTSRRSQHHRTITITLPYWQLKQYSWGDFWEWSCWCGFSPCKLILQNKKRFPWDFHDTKGRFHPSTSIRGSWFKQPFCFGADLTVTVTLLIHLKMSTFQRSFFLCLWALNRENHHFLGCVTCTKRIWITYIAMWFFCNHHIANAIIMIISMRKAIISACILLEIRFWFLSRHHAARWRVWMLEQKIASNYNKVWLSTSVNVNLMERGTKNEINWTRSPVIWSNMVANILFKWTIRTEIMEVWERVQFHIDSMTFVYWNCSSQDLSLLVYELWQMIWLFETEGDGMPWIVLWVLYS